MESGNLTDSNKTDCVKEGLMPEFSSKHDEESTVLSLTSNLESTANVISKCENKSDSSLATEVCKFFLEGKCRFAEKCFNLHPVDLEKNGKQAKVKVEERQSKGTKCSQRTSTKCKSVEDVLDSPKKPSMKTAENVISRILWDDDLPLEHFVIGYLDRFAGIVEKPFSAFSWENIASVDYNVLAVPRHRIQYFRYKKHKVWDKNERLDIVFGSTGYEMNIYDFMKKVDAIQSEKNSSIETEPIPNHQIEALHFKIPNQQHENKPNYFLCIRITNPEIKETVGHFFNQLSQVDSTYNECFISQNQLHITIFMLRLENEMELSKTTQMLQNHKNKFNEFLWPPVELLIEGVDSFKDQVLYAKVSYQSNFLSFVNSIESTLKEGNICIIKDFSDYTPHMTLIRIPRGSERSSKPFSAFLYPSFSERYFGNQKVNNLHLCLFKEKQEDGFYKSLCEIQF